MAASTSWRQPLSPHYRPSTSAGYCAISVDRGGRGGKPLSARSCELAFISRSCAALTWGITEGTVVRNVAAGVKAPRTRATMKSWTAADVRKFFPAIVDDRLVALYTLAVTRGPRRGELCGLKRSTSTSMRCTMSIVDTVVLVDGKPIALGTPKTAAGIRSVPLDPALVRDQGAPDAAGRRPVEGGDRVGGYGPRVHERDRGGPTS